MCVVGHSYGGLAGSIDGGGWYACGRKGVSRMLGDAGAFPESEVTH